ncbi:MAG: S24/S26 family peptidase [Ruminococcus sp.]|nr:S24/S26 family peptidase [Ruminococcus sp.]MBQ3946909.1 S24/S26 family peptidase [Ruminococcus sp.]MBR6395009.1 S24/S26 family peptidase [Ruminococcus sp.]MCR5730293.1 S24/S26 family peptidase [Ruminococcus sp.]
MTELTYEEYLEKNGSMTYSNVGTSMMPLLKQGRDLFTVTKKGSERCRKYDVVLYRRPPDKYVLHRVVKVRENDYVILGDNCINKEYGITDDDILGVMTSFVHKGKQHTVNDMTYRIYSHLWVDLSFFRVKLKKLRMKIKRKRK